MQILQINNTISCLQRDKDLLSILRNTKQHSKRFCLPQCVFAEQVIKALWFSTEKCIPVQTLKLPETHHHLHHQESVAGMESLPLVQSASSQYQQSHQSWTAYD